MAFNTPTTGNSAGCTINVNTTSPLAGGGELTGDLTLTLGTVAIAKGGTGAVTKAAGFDALSPMTTAGDVVYGGASGTGTRLAAGSSTQVLHGGTTPSWAAVSLTADVSGTLPIANGGTGQTTQQAAINALTGTQSSGKFLRSGGTNATLDTIQAGDVTSSSGTYASPNTITAAGGITITAGKQKQVIFTKSNGGAVLITANPQISAGTVVGQELIVVGTDDTNFIGLSDGTGLKINGGPYTMTSHTNVSFFWDGVLWQQFASFGV